MFLPSLPLDDLATSLVNDPALEKRHNVQKPKTWTFWKFWKRQPKQSTNTLPPNHRADELRNAQINTLQTIHDQADSMVAVFSALCVIYRSTAIHTELAQMRAEGEALRADSSRAMGTTKLSRTLIAVLYARSVELIRKYESVALDLEIYRHALEVDALLHSGTVPS